MASWIKVENGSEQEYYDLEKALVLRFNQSIGSIFVGYPGFTVVLGAASQPNAFALAYNYLSTIESSL